MKTLIYAAPAVKGLKPIILYILLFILLLLISNQFNSVTSIAHTSSEIRAQRRRSKSKSAQCRESKLKSLTGRRISEELGGWKPNRKAFFLNEVTVLAVLRLTGRGFQVEGAATAKTLDPHFVR